MPHPHVWIKANEIPKLESLSLNRWICWEVKNGFLYPHKIDNRCFWGLNGWMVKQREYCNMEETRIMYKAKKHIRELLQRHFGEELAELLLTYMYWA